MILRSHKKHPTTHLIKLAWATSSVVTMFCLGGGTCSAQNLISLGFETEPASAPAVQLLGMEEIESEEPLNRLKQRSPEARWNKVREEALSSQPVSPEQPPRGAASSELPELNGIQEFQPFTSNQNPQRTAQPPAELPALPEPDTKIEFYVPTSSQTRTEPQSTVLPQPTPFVQFDPFTAAPPMPQELPADELTAEPESYQSVSNTNPLRPLGQIQPYYDYESIRPGLIQDVETYRVPVDVSVSEPTSHELAPRLSPDTIFSWEATNLWHNPLYFEDPSLERYGHVAPPILQPLISTSRLGVQLFGLPYQMSIDPVRKKRYALGWYQPGDEVPHLFYLPPWNLKAAAVQAGAISAGVGILP